MAFNLRLTGQLQFHPLPYELIDSCEKNYAE